MKVKKSKYVNYLIEYKKHVNPALGKIPYCKLTIDRLNDFIQAKLSSGLSPKYIADISGVVRSVCRYVKKRFGYDDKSEFISIPKGKPKEKGLLDKMEQVRLNSYLKEKPTLSNIGILLSSSTGI